MHLTDSTPTWWVELTEQDYKLFCQDIAISMNFKGGVWGVNRCNDFHWTLHECYHCLDEFLKTTVPITHLTLCDTKQPALKLEILFNKDNHVTAYSRSKVHMYCTSA